MVDTDKTREILSGMEHDHESLGERLSRLLEVKGIEAFNNETSDLDSAIERVEDSIRAVAEAIEGKQQ